jgi:RNA polymerase sigma factor (sigma-70 family)
MSLPTEPVTLGVEQIGELNRKLADLRHDINNYASLILASAELLRRRPETAERMMAFGFSRREKYLADSRTMERTEAELIAAVLKGDSASFEPLVQKYSPRVFATARRYARRESEVEDIAQEVWLKAFRQAQKFPGEAPFEHWLMRMTVRTCYDFLRGHQRNRESSFSDLSEPESDWLERFVTAPETASENADAAKTARRTRAGTAFAAGAAGHHAAGNRRPVGEGDRRAHRLVGAAGEGPRLPRARRDAENSGQNGKGQVSVTPRGRAASKKWSAYESR